MRYLLASALCAILTACSGSSGGGPILPPQPATFAGEWIGTYQSSRGPVGSIGCTITQSGPEIGTRDLEVIGGQCRVSPWGAGQATGNTMSLTAQMLAGGELVVTATMDPIAGATLLGQYEVLGGPCVGDFGQVSLFRTGP